jgi:CheY-like chemotaxis protein
MQPAEVEHGDEPTLAAHRELVGELAEQLAHELANRLAVARLTAEVLANRPDLPGDLADRVATVVRSTGAAGDLVQQLSVVAGRRPAPPHRLDLAKVAAELSGLLQAGLGRRPLELAIAPAVVEADRRDVEEVLLRLVLAGDRGPNDAGIALSVATDGDDVVVVVRRPTPLPPDVASRVATLAPGHTVDGDDHTVRWPAVPEERLDVVPVPKAGAVVLVVEDDTDLRELVCGALAADGYQVEGVADARAALTHPSVVDNRVDLLVTDVELPGMSGLQLAETLLGRGVRVLVMSGHGEAALGDDLPDGAEVLDKPFGVPDLRTKARQALQ